MKLKARENQSHKRNVAFKGSTSKKSYKKNAMKAIQEDMETKSDEEVDTTTMCFMAQRQRT